MRKCESYVSNTWRFKRIQARAPIVNRPSSSIVMCRCNHVVKKCFIRFFYYCHFFTFLRFLIFPTFLYKDVDKNTARMHLIWMVLQLVISDYWRQNIDQRTHWALSNLWEYHYLLSSKLSPWKQPSRFYKTYLMWDTDFSQGRRHGFESFFDPPHFLASGGTKYCLDSYKVSLIPLFDL